MRVVLLHSPLVGPNTWAAVATQLRHGGHQVVVPDLRAAATGDPPRVAAIGLAVTNTLDLEPGGGPLVLVGHSGAGPLLPGLADACGDSVQAVLFVDAVLPRPGTTWFERAPDELADHIRRLAEDGLLPPWDEWFDTGTMETLISDPTVLEQFRRELPRVPIALFTEPTPPVTWTGRCGYLLLSEAYVSQAAEARHYGWPVLEHASHHLAMLTEPASIAEAVAHLVRLLVTDSSAA
jgi:pimeloyl-ACP methyl ester carboxylesterase